MDVFQTMYETGAIPVITVSDPAKAVLAAKAMLAGGVKTVEIALRVPGAADCIRAVRAECPGMAVGAGTVLTQKQVDEAQRAGAMFMVAPGFDRDVVEHCIKTGLPFIPGTVHSTDIQAGIRMGLAVLKFFPSEPFGGLVNINYLSAPFPKVRFIPAGGVSFDNLPAYLNHPAVLCCAGGFMCRSEHIDSGEWEKITRLCRRVSDIAQNRTVSNR